MTAAIATIAYGRFVAGQWKRQKSLEDYLREEKLSGYDEGTPFDWREFEAEASDPANHIAFTPVPVPRQRDASLARA